MENAAADMDALTAFYREWDSADDFVRAHTSGSTGEPKPVRLLKADMLVSARATNGFFGLGPDSVLALPLSLDYIAGKMMAVRARMAGCSLLCLPVSNEVTLTGPVDLLAVVPSQVPSLLRERGGARYARNLLVGGAALPVTTERRLLDAGVRAFVGYGMTETCSHVALRRVGSDLYEAMPGIRFESDPRGCLAIVSENFSWRRLVTNDVVSFEGPRAFRWLGRADNVINSGGIKIHPELLEAEINSLVPGMAPFYVVGEPDYRWGECAVMVAERGATEPDLRVLKSLLADSRHCPKRVVYVDTLPRTPGGNKIRRLRPDELGR